MGQLLHALHERKPIDPLTHYVEQATLAGSATHIAALISRGSYRPDELAMLLAAVTDKIERSAS